MRYSSITLLPLALALVACGNDSGQQAAAPAAPAESAAPAEAAAPAAPTASAPAAAPQVASESTAAPVSDEEVVYDPIDVSKLQNAWWQQYSKGG
ncbi:MAG: hypothetical protein AB7V59_18305 [Gammaproteobacteria bacterium]